MAEATRELVVVVTHGADREMSSVAFTIANGGMTSGLKVAIFLTGNGVDLVRRRAIENLVVHPLEPLAALIKDFLARGGRLWACTPCVKARGYEQSDLIDGVEIAGSSKMHELIKAGAATLSFWSIERGEFLMQSEVPVDAVKLRDEVRSKYREVALKPDATYHFHTGRPLAQGLGYDAAIVAALPDAAVESFAGVANPFSMGKLRAGEKVVDVGSGAGFDSFIAAGQVGPLGRVVGVDMTAEMLAKSRSTAAAMGVSNIEFRAGLAEGLPVEDGWADVVISNGVINLCADKRTVFAEIRRVLRPGGRLQFADIANGQPVPEAAIRDVDLWTAWIAGGLPCAGWRKLMEETGFDRIEIGRPMDTFGGASGERNARRFEVYGYAFMARRRP